MKNYDLIDLSDPAVYAADEELMRLTRKAADIHFKEVAAGRMGYGEFKRRLQNGEYPELMKGLVQKAFAAQLAREQQALEDEQVLDALQLPKGYRAFRCDGENRVTGPFDDNLHRRLKRIGHWSSEDKCWVIDDGKASSLKRIFANWMKHREKLVEARSANRNSEVAHSAAPVKCQPRSTQRRVKVPVDQYRPGDLLDGQRIASLGRPWTEPGEPDLSGYPIQLWEACGCGREPVYARAGLEHMGSQKCASCIAREQSVPPVQVCYAYLESPDHPS